jgi:hypothetical protein
LKRYLIASRETARENKFDRKQIKSKKKRFDRKQRKRKRKEI